MVFFSFKILSQVFTPKISHLYVVEERTQDIIRGLQHLTPSSPHSLQHQMFFWLLEWSCYKFFLLHSSWIFMHDPVWLAVSGLPTHI